MKPIRLHFVDFTDELSSYGEHLISNLSEKLGSGYEFILDSENPQFLFCWAESTLAQFYGKHFLYPNACKIFMTGECVTPNFNFYDYAIAHDYLDWSERYLHCPDLYTVSISSLSSVVGVNKDWKNLSKEEVKTRKKFCNFIYSHGNLFGPTPREDFFNLLSQYKQVDAAGRFLRNTNVLAEMEREMGVPKSQEAKRTFIKDYKFTIAFENQSYPGYTTEKILDAFMSRTVPIYWGNLRVTEDFVPGAFINANDFDSLEAVAEEVKRLDQDDDAYMEMLNTHPIPEAHRSGDYWGDKRAQFLKSIFDQPPEKARRRPKAFPITMEPHVENILQRHSTGRA